MILEKKNIKSNFVAYLSIKNNKKVNEKFILPLVNNFFKHKKINNFKEISENYEISDEDFKYKNFDDFFSYFYENIMEDISKNNNEIEITVKYCITLDKQNCLKKCNSTGIFYDEILLYNQPVFYFIYIDINDVFSFLRQQNTLDKI
ncbi:MAG: hypothetical protein KAI02_03940 [Gammaproteobacteria bacterium]|nr:hypothetical protein [Gammaproteobacteria bacterium]